MQLPDFLVAGAMKAGTSTLRAMLNQHPQVFMSKRKELHFFDAHFERGPQWYARKFRPDSTQIACGEATPIYMADHVFRERMHQTVPRARVIVILREPAARANSHYWMLRARGAEPLDSFEAGLAAEEDRWRIPGDPRAKWRFAYKHRGHYAEQLKGLQSLFGREGLHVIIFEEFVRNPHETMRDVFAFIGVDPAFADSVHLEHRLATKTALNKKGMEYPEIAPATRDRLTDYFAPLNTDLEDWLGRRLTTWAS